VGGGRGAVGALVWCGSERSSKLSSLFRRPQDSASYARTHANTHTHTRTHTHILRDAERERLTEAVRSVAARAAPHDAHKLSAKRRDNLCDIALTASIRYAAGCTAGVRLGPCSKRQVCSRLHTRGLGGCTPAKNCSHSTESSRTAPLQHFHSPFVTQKCPAQAQGTWA
jgi:hypothetical protein